MDANTKRRIRETAVKILQAAKEMQTHSDVDSQRAGDLMVTEDGLCAAVSGSLGLDLSSDFQVLVRDVMKSDELSNQAEGGDEEDLDFAKFLDDELEKQTAIDSADVMKSDELPNQAEGGDEEDLDFAKFLDDELEKQTAIDFADDIFTRTGHRLICWLAKNKLATVTKFKGQRMVSLRKWYPIEGKLKPCEAGIHLRVEEWEKLRDKMNDVDQVISMMQNAKPGGC